MAKVNFRNFHTVAPTSTQVAMHAKSVRHFVFIVFVFLLTCNDDIQKGLIALLMMSKELDAGH